MYCIRMESAVGTTISSYVGAMSNAEFEERELALGFTYSPESLLLDEELVPYGQTLI